MQQNIFKKMALFKEFLFKRTNAAIFAFALLFSVSNVALNPNPNMTPPQQVLTSIVRQEPLGNINV